MAGDPALGQKGRGDPVSEGLDDVLTAPPGSEATGHHDGDVIHPRLGGVFEDAFDDAAPDVETHPGLHRVDVSHHDGQLHPWAQQPYQGGAVDGIGERPLHQSDRIRGGHGLRRVDHAGSGGKTLQADVAAREGQQRRSAFVDFQNETGAGHDGSFHLGCSAWEGHSMIDQPDSLAARIRPMSGLTATGFPTERSIGRST